MQKESEGAQKSGLRASGIIALTHPLLFRLPHIHQRYSALRRVRGDGNCFYRSFLFGYLERLLHGIKSVGDSNTKAMLELSRLRQVVYDRYVRAIPLLLLVSLSSSLFCARSVLVAILVFVPAIRTESPFTQHVKKTPLSSLHVCGHGP